MAAQPYFFASQIHGPESFSRALLPVSLAQHNCLWCYWGPASVKCSVLFSKQRERKHHTPVFLLFLTEQSVGIVVPLFSTFKILTIKNQWLFPSISHLKKYTVSINKGKLFYLLFFFLSNICFVDVFLRCRSECLPHCLLQEVGWKGPEISGLHS